MSGVRRIGILTGGGDAPGLNPAIKSAVYRASALGLEVVGLYDGWRSLLDPLPETLPLTRATVRRWDRDGGTNLGSSRTNPFKTPDEKGERSDRSDEAVRNVEKLGLDALIVCGGEDTLGVAARLAQKGVPLVGVPKTIDKDVWGTDYTLGFDTALRNVTEYIERSRTPAGSHGWVQVVEVMGRHAGHLALWSGVAGGADIILIPEHPFRHERIAEYLIAHLGPRAPLVQRNPVKPRYAVIVAAEGAFAQNGAMITVGKQEDAFGHVRLGGVGELVAEHIRRHTPYEARSAMLGHPQRGGAPSPVDRVMGVIFGAKAVEAVAAGEFGMMVAARGVAPACQLSLISLTEVLDKLNTVDVAQHYDTERYHLKGIGA